MGGTKPTNREHRAYARELLARLGTLGTLRDRWWMKMDDPSAAIRVECVVDRDVTSSELERALLSLWSEAPLRLGGDDSLSFERRLDTLTATFVAKDGGGRTFTGSVVCRWLDQEAKARIIDIARKGSAGDAEIPFVLDVARRTRDRHLLRVCLDCFRSVLEDSRSDHAYETARLLGAMVVDPQYRRIRRSVFIALDYIGEAAHVVLPEIFHAFRRSGPSSTLVPARSAVLRVSWEALRSAHPEAQRRGLEAFESLQELGLLNLESFLEHQEVDEPLRSRIHDAIARLSRRFPER